MVPWMHLKYAQGILLLSIPLLIHHGQATLRLPTRVFVLPMTASGDLFSVATVPAAENEAYSFRKLRDGLDLNTNTGMVKVTEPNWHKDETEVTLLLTITSATGSGKYDAKLEK